MKNINYIIFFDFSNLLTAACYILDLARDIISTAIADNNNIIVTVNITLIAVTTTTATLLLRLLL